MGSPSKHSLKEKLNFLTSEPLNVHKMEDFKKKYHNLESEYRTKIKRIEELESDKVLLMEDLNDSEAYIKWQEEELKRLKNHLESLSTDMDKVQAPKLEPSSSDESQNEESTTKQELEALIAVKNNENENLLRANEKMKEAIKQIAKNFIESLQKMPRKEHNHPTPEVENVLREKDSVICSLEEENHLLLEEVNNYEEYIAQHIDQMKQLATQIDGYTNEKTHTKPNQINCYKAKLRKEIQNNKLLTQQLRKQKKSREETEKILSKTVKVYKNILKENQDLKNRCNILRCQNSELESLRLKAQRIDELEKKNKCLLDEIKAWKCQEESYARHIDDLNNEICDYKSSLVVKDQNAKILLNALEHEKSQVDNLKLALCELSNSEEELKEMLSQARSTIKAITQKLEENDIERLELEDRSQNIIEKYNTLKSCLYEKDKSFDELRNQLITLKHLLDKEQKFRKDRANLEAAGDSEIAQQVKQLNEEIARLKKELEHLMISTPIGRLKCKIKKLENENLELQTEHKKFVAYLKKIVPGYIDPEELKRMRQQLSDLSKEVEIQKLEVENQKKLRLETVQQMKEKLGENEEIENLRKENEDLKAQIKEKEIDEDLPEKVLKTHHPIGAASFVIEIPESKSELDDAKRQELKKLHESQSVNDSKMLKKLAKTNHEIQEISEKLTKAKSAVPQLSLDTNLINEPDEKLKELEKKLFYANEEIKRLKHQLKQAENNNNDNDENKNKLLEEKLFNAIKENEQLKTQLETAKASSSRRLSNQSDQIKELEEKLKVANSQSNDATIKQLEEKLFNAIKENEQLKTQLEAAKTSSSRRLSNQSGQIKELENKLKRENSQSNETTIKQLEEKLFFSNEEYNRLKKDFENLEKEKQKIEEMYNANCNKLKELHVSNTKLQEVVGKLDPELEKQYEVLKKINEQLEVENLKLKNEKGKPQSVDPNDFYHQQLNEISDNMLSWQERMNATLTAMAMKIQKLEMFHEEEEEGENLATSKVNLMDQIDNIKNELDTIATKKRVLITQDAQDVHIEQLENNLHALQKENKALQHEIAVLRAGSTQPSDVRIRDLEQQLKTSEIQKKNLQSEIDNLRFQRMSTMSMVSRGSIDDKDFRFPRLMAGLTSDDERVQELEKLLVEWQRNYYRDIVKLKSEMEEITNQSGNCEEHGKKIKELETNLEEAQHKIENLIKTNMQLEADNEQLSTAMRFEGTAAENADFEKDGDQKMHSLVEHLRAIERKNQSLKTRVVELEVDNGRLRNDLESVIGKDPKSFEEERKRLRNLERQASKCQEKFQSLKKRTAKLEIENRNLQKEYINILIEKEKLVLQAHENTSRFRETNRLLKKAQDKIQTLTNRIIKIQNENERLKKQLDSVITDVPELEDGTSVVHNKNFVTARNAVLEEENAKLRALLERINDYSEQGKSVQLPQEVTEFLSVQKDDDLRFKAVLLQLENETLKKELDSIKNRDLVSLAGDLAEQKLAEHFGDLNQIDQQKTVDMQYKELQIENDFLRKELAVKESVANTYSEKRITELEEENHKLSETIDNLKKDIVDLELENDFFKHEMDKMGKISTSETPTADVTNLEKQIHAQKAKIENLQQENKKLKNQIENLGKAEMDLQVHVQKKLIREIERVLKEHEDLKNQILTKTNMKNKSSDDLLAKLEVWRDHYQPELEKMKQDVERMIGKENLTAKLQNQIEEYKVQINDLENDNQNMRIALELLLEEKAIITNAKLVQKVQDQLLQQQEIKLSSSDDSEVKKLKKELEDLQQINELLRKEKVLLSDHSRENRIKELEAQVHNLKALGKSRLTSTSTLDAKKSISPDELEQIKTQKESLEKQVYSLTSERTILHTDLKRFQTENEALKEEISRYDKINEKIKSDFTKQIDEMKNATRRIDNDPNSEAESLKYDFQILHKKYEEKSQKLASLETKMKKCKESNDELKQKVSTLHRNFELLQKHSDFDTESIGTLNAVTTDEKKLNKFQKELEKKQKKIAELEEQLKKCREMNKDLKKKVAVLEKNTSANFEQDDGVDDGSNQSASEEKVKKTTSFADEVGKQKQDFKSSNLQRENTILKSRSEQLNNQLEQKSNKLKEMQIEVENLREENRTLQNEVKRVKVLEERLREANSRYTKVKTELDRLQKNSGKKSDRKLADIEKQLADKEIENEVMKENLEYLKKELQNKDTLEEENKDLKEEINQLTKKLNSSLEEKEKLEHEINDLKKSEEHLKQINKNLNEENEELEEKLKRYDFEEMNKTNDNQKENEKLKLLISDLQKEKSDKIDKIKELNEIIKGKIDLIQNERVNLIKDLHKFLEAEKSSSTNEIYSKLIENLQDILNSKSTSDQKSTGLEEEMRSYKLENEKLKLSTIQLEEEVLHLKQSISEDDYDKFGLGDRQRIKILEHELYQQKKKWKNILSRLKEQYHEGILVRNTMTNPWGQPLMQPPFPPMPVFYQPMVTYPPNPDENLEQLSEMIYKIEKNLDRNKKVLGNESTKLSKQSLIEESELDEDTCASYNLKTISSNESNLPDSKVKCKLILRAQSLCGSEKDVVVAGSSKKSSLKCQNRDRFPSIFPHYRVFSDKKDDDLDRNTESD